MIEPLDALYPEKKTEQEPIRIMLADDHLSVREGYRLLLTLSGMEVIAEASSGRQAYTLYRQVQPDIVVMDISMEEMDGLESLLLQTVCTFSDNAP